MLATAQAVGLRGTFALPQSRSLVEVPGLGGHFYSQYGPGQPVVAVPWIWAGHGLAAVLGLDTAGQGFVVRFVLGSFNLLVAAVLVALLYAVARRLGAGQRGGLLLAALLAFATFLWPESRSFFAEPLTALLLFGAFAALGVFGRPFLAGLLATLTLAVKIQYVVALPGLGLLAGWLAYRAWRAGDRRAAGRVLGGFALGGVLGAVPLLAYNTLAFGSPFTSGYHQSFAETFTTPLLEGLNGLLLSPGKGLWLYAPPVLLGLSASCRSPGAIRPWPRGRHRECAHHGPVRPLPLLAGRRKLGAALPDPAAAVPGAAGARPAAGGDAPSQPFAAWSSARRLGAAAFALLGVAGLAVQLLGALVNFDTYINLVNDDNTRYWNATYSPVRGHWQVLNARVGAWLARRQYPHADIALLSSGFSYSEGDKYAGDLFPRWTTGTATVAVPDISGYPLTLTMRLADHRPPPLPRADVALSLAGQPVPADRQPVPDSPVASVLTATIARPAVPAWSLMNLALTSPTWNPKQIGAGARNEDLGLLVEALSLQRADGRPLRLVEALAVQPMYPAPRWYYDTQSPHLADV